MSKTTSVRARRVLASLTTAALVLAGSVSVLAAPAAAADRTFVLVGSLQSELGCPDDGQPDCDATALTATDDEGVRRRVRRAGRLVQVQGGRRTARGTRTYGADAVMNGATSR